MRLQELKVQEVVYVPEELEPGVLYVSYKFKTAIHVCPCGNCSGKKDQVVTPFGIGEHGWSMDSVEGAPVTLRPSISNPWCGAHYYITANKIDWL